MYKKAFVYLTLILSSFLFTNTSYASTQQVDILVKNLLLDDNPLVRKLGAKLAHSENIEDQQIYDILAYYLYDGVGKSRDTDLLSWYAKALKNSQNSRYLSVLTSSKKPQNAGKLNHNIDNAIKGLKKSTPGDSVFEIDSFELPEKQQAINEAQTTSLPSNIKIGTSLDAILDTLGQPSSAGYDIVTIKRPFVGRINTQRLTLKYDGLVNLRLHSDKGKQIIERLWPTLKWNGKLPEDSHHAKLAEALINGSPIEYRAAAQTISGQKIKNETLLDIAVSRVWNDKMLEDDYAVDAMAWAIKAIMTSKNKRYADVIGKIETQAVSGKVKKYARKAKPLLTDGTSESFQP